MWQDRRAHAACAGDLVAATCTPWLQSANLVVCSSTRHALEDIQMARCSKEQAQCHWDYLTAQQSPDVSTYTCVSSMVCYTFNCHMHTFYIVLNSNKLA
jgi:hypothetical protein